MSADSNTARVSARPRITVAEVRASINTKAKRESVTLTWYGRPLANLITPAFYNAGWSANQVTAWRSGLAAAALGLIATPWAWAAIPAALIYYLTFVLDCVDGNLARLADRATYWGKFVDGLGDYIYLMGAPFAAGIGIWLTGGDALALLAGAVITVVALASQLCRERLNFFREWMTGQSGPLDEETQRRAALPARMESVAAEILIAGTFLAPILLFVPEQGRRWYLFALIAVQFVPDLVWVAATFWKGRIWLARGRKSVHAVAAPAKPKG